MHKHCRTTEHYAAVMKRPTETLAHPANHILLGSLTVLTKHSPRRHRFSVQPERHLGKNDCHDARQVRLDDKVANLPLQMEMSRHHCVFTCGEMIQGQLTEQHSCQSNDHLMQTLTPDCIQPTYTFRSFYFTDRPRTSGTSASQQFEAQHN